MLWELATDRVERFPADAHTARRLALDGEVACWEQWTGDEVDVHCSDGVQLRRPGHQRNPSRFGRWLLVVEEGRALQVDLGGSDTVQP